jgi:hypothetical protein
MTVSSHGLFAQYSDPHIHVENRFVHMPLVTANRMRRSH